MKTEKKLKRTRERIRRIDTRGSILCVHIIIFEKAILLSVVMVKYMKKSVYKEDFRIILSLSFLDI